MSQSRNAWAVAMAMAVASGGAAAPAWSASGDAQDNSGLQEIVVTASKREEKAQDVPTALSTVSTREIENLGIQQLSDYAPLVPGFSFRDNGAPGYGVVILRGLNTGSDQLTNTSASYFDEAAVTASGSLSVGGVTLFDPYVADLERIEVLKGPQGTLYGASNLGGVVRLVTKKPDLDGFSSSVRVEGSEVEDGRAGYGGRASLNVPLIDNVLAVRVSGFYRHIPGFVDNVDTGTSNVNDGYSDGGHVALRFKPRDDLTVDLSGTYQDTKTNGLNYTQALTNTLAPQYGRYEYKSVFDEGTHSRYAVGNLKTDYDTSAGTLTATGSYAHYSTEFFIDYTDAYGPFIPPAFGPIALPTIGSPDMDKYTGEIRFASKRMGPIEFLSGGYATTEQTHYPVYAYMVSLPSKALFAPPYDVFVASTTNGTYKEYAGFGNLTFYFTDDLDLTGGYRYSHNDQNFHATPGVLFFAPLPGKQYQPLSDNDSTYLATLRWRPTADVSTYLRAASGYRPGAVQTSLAPTAPKLIKPDTVWNYEAGIKGSTADRLLSGDLAVYHIHWENIQLNGLQQGLVFLANGGSANVNGVELELQLRPVTGLVLGLNYAYTHSRLGEVNALVTNSIGASAGDSLPLTPLNAASLTADYGVPLAGNMTFTSGVTVRTASSKHSSYPGNPDNPDQILPGFTAIDARAGLSRGHYNVQLRVENLANKFAIQSAQTFGVYAGQPNAPTLLIPIQPRTVVLSLGADF